VTRAINLKKKETLMNAVKTSVLALSLLAFASNAGAIDINGICCDGGFEYRHPSAWEKEQQRVKDELAAAQKQLADRDREIAALRSGSSDALRSAQADLDRSKTRTAELERQLADRDREMASLRSGAGDSAKLSSQLEAANSRNSALEAQLAAMGGTAADKDKLAAELAAAKQRVAELEGQLADRDKELAGLRGELSAEMAKLKEAQRGLIRALRPQIEKGDITVDLNNERLLINLASHYLFATGEDALKPAGADALKQVGTILKDFPEYKVAVDGHTDNVPIRGELKKKFPTNKELSEARAANAAKALADGGLGNATTTGYADTKPVEPNTTAAGRAKNRRVEVRVTR
jgi:chemotaxis protein MotB